MVCLYVAVITALVFINAKILTGEVLAQPGLGFELGFGEYPFHANMLIFIFDFNVILF